jgi:hypothetical protein
MDATDDSTAAHALPSLTKVPIARLSPTLEQLEEKCILATVSLVWPYSSSTKSLSLSLAEPDFRLRRSNGQVKAIFHGRVAEKVAETQVGIGDTVRLALKGADFVGTDAATQTPGRNVAWDLHFDNGVSIEVLWTRSPHISFKLLISKFQINRFSKNLSTVIIEQSPRASHDTELQPPSTPRVISIDPISDTAHGPGSWVSPAFARIGQSLFKTARDSFDPFAEEDGSIPGKGRKRPRYSFQRDEWRIADSSASSREDGSEDLENDWEKELENEVDAQVDLETTPEASHENGAPALDDSTEDQASVESPLQDRSSVFVKPSLDLAGSLFGKRAPQSRNAPTGPIGTGFQGLFGAASHLPTDTPHLRPVPSPGLPVPSPIVSNNNNAQEYFSPLHAQQQAQTIQSIVTGTEADTTALSQSSGVYISPTSQSQTITALTEQLETTQHGQTLSSPTVPGDKASPLNRATGIVPAWDSNETPTESTEFFNSPTFQEHPEFNEPDIEMGAAGDIQTIPVAEPVHRQPEGTDEVEEETDAEEDVPHQEQEPATAADDEESDVEPVQGSLVRADRAHDEAAVHAARIVVDMETAEGEPDEHVPEVIESEDEGDEAVEASRPAEHRSRSRTYSDESDEEDEALYDEDDAADSMLEDDEDEGDYDDGDEYSGDEYPQATHLPRPQQTQPEVIVLDSDSEDELASDQPTQTPLQPAQQESSYHRESFIETRGADFAAKEEGEEEDVYESDSDAMEHRDQGADDGRVHDSDIEDESSVDELAHDHYADQHFRRKHSVEEESVGEEDDDRGLDAEVAEPRTTGVDTNIGEKPGSVIDIDSDEDEPEEEPEAESDEESEEEAEEDQQASPDEPGSPGQMRSAFHGLDGASDRDRVQSPVDAEGDQKEGPEGETVSERQWRDSDLANGVSPGDTAKQLLTPDPTQEAASGRRSPPMKEKMAVAPAVGKSGPPLGLNISSTPGLETAPTEEEATLDEDLLPSEHPAAEGLPGILHKQEHQDGTDDADVAVPTTEHVGVNGNRPKTPDHDKAPAAPKVVVTKHPVPDRHAHGLRSKLSYFAPLATLIDHYNVLVDTISVVHEATPIAKGSSGSRDYFMTVQLTDPSMAGTTLQAQIFRRTKSAMPSLAEGSAILLRDFKVRSYDHSIMLVSVESSSWAVFDGSAPEAQMSGPPVEYGSEERAYASGLRRWYTQVGAFLVADNQLQASIERDSMDRGVTPSDMAISDAGSLDSGARGDSLLSSRGLRRSRRSNRRVTIHELRDGTRYTEVGSPGSRESIHELRDGTVYADL